MLQIPEYHSLAVPYDIHDAEGGSLATIAVSVKIDSTTGWVPPRSFEPVVMARLVQAFASGELEFMSFDEHPKRLTGISLRKRGRVVQGVITAISLTESDAIGTDWETQDARDYGAPAWNGQMK